jgi:hypothetical protein
MSCYRRNARKNCIKPSQVLNYVYTIGIMGEQGAAPLAALSAKRARNGLWSDINIHAIERLGLSQLLYIVSYYGRAGVVKLAGVRNPRAGLTASREESGTWPKLYNVQMLWVEHWVVGRTYVWCRAL